jgi:RNA polymerase sigma-70 factor (ECF subfamily)
MLTLKPQLNKPMAMSARSKYHATEEQMLSEQEMVEAAKKDSANFEPLYKKYHEQIFRYIYQRLDDKELAFDATSQVFLKAMMNLYRYEFRGVPFSSWLYRIAYSEINNMFKERKAQRSVNIDTVNITDICDELEEDDREAVHAILIEAIGELKEGDLQLIEMRFFEKRAFREIAEILDITENNAKVKTYRILDKLKKNIMQKL